MKTEDRIINGVLVVKPIEKRIEASNSSAFKDIFIDHINSGKCRMVLNLSEVEFIDSSGLGSIISVLKTLSGRGDIVLCEIQPSVLSLFTLTRMNRVFKIYETQDEALTFFNEERGL